MSDGSASPNGHDDRTESESTESGAQSWRNRIIRQDVVDPKTLTPNPRNWRRHTKAQDRALSALLKEVGWVGQILWNERTGNIIDGHERVELAIRADEPEIPRIVVDLSEDEELLVLGTFDPIGAMAETNAAMLAEVIENAPDITLIMEEFKTLDLEIPLDVERSVNSGFKQLTFMFKHEHAKRVIDLLNKVMDSAEDIGPHKQSNALYHLLFANEA